MLCAKTAKFRLPLYSRGRLAFALVLVYFLTTLAEPKKTWATGLQLGLLIGIIKQLLLVFDQYTSFP